MSIKNIKEKELLINLSKTFGQDIDPSIVEEVNRQKEFEQSIKQSARSNWIKDLQEALQQVKTEVQTIKNQPDFPMPPSLDELEEFLSQTTEEVNDLDSPQEPENASEQIETKTESLAERAARAIKLNENSYQQPVAPAVDPKLSSVIKKLQYLEQWISKVSVAGPGGGESSQAGLYMPIRAVTTNSYTVTSKDYYIGVNYSGAVTIYLPIAMNPGRKFVVKDELGEASRGTNRHITIMSAGSDKIDNQDRAILAFDYGSLTFVYRPGNWRVI